jgi:hypothetical protein
MSDKRSGQGIATYGDGSEYKGEWADGFYCGCGVFTSQLAVFSGVWLSDGKAGCGTIAYKNDTVYEGDWLNAKRHGRGIMRYANGDTFSGVWSKNLRHGRGTLTPGSGGPEIECDFENDFPVVR